ncbi:MAG: glycosyltransferase family 4 protein [Flavobacteriales bacterium]|nr:glycosyltransferase family 4 protein [Flavobacteriales bacterium]
MKSLRIGLDAKRAFCNATGLGNYSRNIIRSLVLHYPQHTFFLFTPEIKLASFYDEMASYPHVSIITPKQAYSKWFTWYWRSYTVAKLANHLNLDVYHGLSHELPIGLNKTIRSVVTIHDMIIFKDVSFQNIFDIFNYRSKIRKAIHRADRIIAISNQTKTDIITFFPEVASKIQVVYQPIDERFYQQVSDDVKESVLKQYNIQKPYLIQVGSIQLRKNIQQVLMALYLLKDKTIHYVVVGKSSRYQRSLEEYARNFGIANRVKFLNQVPDDTLPALYQASTAVIYPSLMEGFGLPIVEGLASEVPVIATQGGCFEEAGGTAPLYVDTTSEHAIAAAITYVIDPHKDFNSRIITGKEHLKRFSPPSIAEALVQVYTM